MKKLKTDLHTRWTYINGCRCSVCILSNRLYQRDYLRRRRAAGLVDCHGKKLSAPSRAKTVLNTAALTTEPKPLHR